MATVTTSHYKIYEYWRDKIIRANGEIVKSEDHYQEGDEIVVDDAYCPRCWGCGCYVVRDSKIDAWINKNCSSEDEEFNLKNLWNSKETKSKLNRCHIIPGALGGADTPSNLFLMCSECHQLSPDTIYPSMFFKWVLERRKKFYMGTWNPEYLLLEASKLLERDYGTKLMDLLERIHKLGGDNKLNTLNEFMHQKIGTHGTKIAESSAIVAVEKWLVSIYTDLSLE